MVHDGYAVMPISPHEKEYGTFTKWFTGISIVFPLQCPYNELV